MSDCMKKITGLTDLSRAVAVVATACLLAHPVQAAPRLYPLGGGFEGGLEVEAGGVHVQNFFYESDGGLDVLGYRARPSVVLARGGSDAKLQLGSYIESTHYDLPSPLDHYLDFGSSARFDWVPLTKHRFDVGAEYVHGHDQSGLVRSQSGDTDFDRSNEPDEWDNGEFDFGYRYGGPSALAVSSIQLGYREREYTNNRSRTNVLDYATRSIGYELAYTYSPKTSFLFDVGHAATDYDLGNRDGKATTARVGLRWVATGKTSGDLRVGVRTYSVDSRARPSSQSFTWKLKADWAPTSLTQFNLSGGRSVVETFRTNAFFIDTRSVDLNWRQKWAERFSTRAGLGYVNTNFVGANRKDDNVSAYVGADLALLPGFALFADYSYRDRSSNEALRGFEHAEAKFGLKWNP